jgi:hypothetical protein
VAAVETGYGTAIVGYLNGVATNDYFGLHVNTATDDSHYLYQTGVYTTGTPTNPVYVAEFAAQTRFLDSGLGFVSAERPYVMNDTSPTQFALAIHAQGYGVGTPGYVWRFDSANNIIKAREDCPH